MIPLQNLLGLSPTGRHTGEPKLTIIATKLQGERATVPSHTWGSFARWLFATHAALRGGFEGNSANEDIDNDFEAFVEIFSSNAGRYILGQSTAVDYLGWADTETDGDPTESWRESGWWNPVAMSCDWRLYSHATNTGTLYRLSYYDEGYELSYWFYLPTQAGVRP